MSRIVVIFYSYKDKLLKNCIDSILDNQSGFNDVSINVIDRNNLDRSENFNGVSYSFEMWDSTKSKFVSRNEIVNSHYGDYLLYIDGSKEFIRDWDVKLIDMLETNEVLSGTNDIVFSNTDHKFFCTYEKHPAKEKNITKWIDTSFIFTTFEIFKSFPSLTQIKHRGESEILSLFCFINSINIFCVPSNLVVSIGKDLLDYDYIPFSINHNYNSIIDVFNGRGNIFFDEVVDIGKFEKFISYDFSKLSSHPFPENDIEYDPRTSLDDIDGKRFFGGINSIY